MNNPLILTDPTGLQAATNVEPCPAKNPCSEYQWNPEMLDAGFIQANGRVNGGDVIAEGNGVGEILTDNAIQGLLAGFNQRLGEIQDGSSTGGTNAVINLANSALTLSYNARGIYYGVPQIPRYEYSSLAGARFGTAIEGVALVAPAIFGGVFSAAGAGSLSVAPRTSGAITTTQRLQFHVNRAAREIDAAEMQRLHPGSLTH
jgi:hypothetical protein